MIVVLGSGMAGHILCEKIRSLDKDVAITMISRQDGSYYPKPQLSVGWAKKKEAADLVTESAQEISSRLNLKVMTHVEIHAIDTAHKRVVTSHGEISYTHCVYALGSDAIQLSVKKPEDVQVLNNLDDYDAFVDFMSRWAHGHKPKIGVIGCGLVGYKLIATLSELGCQVAAFHDKSYMLNQLLPQKGQIYVTDVVKNHCDFYPGFKTTEITKGKDQYLISDGKIAVKVDHVIEAVGVRGNSLTAEQAGLKVDSYGVVVNDFGQCQGFNDLWALGDCASFQGASRKYVGHIRQMADIIAHNITQKEKRAIVSTAMPYNIKSSLCPVSVMGEFDEGLEWVWESSLTGMVGKQFESGKMTGWCVIGDMPPVRSSLIRASR